MRFGRIRDLLLTLLLILSVDGCNSDKKDVNAEGANSTSNVSKDGGDTLLTGSLPPLTAGDKHTIPSGMTIPTEKMSSYIVSLSDGTTDVQGEINEWGIEVKIPCNITETNSPVKLRAYSRTFTIASSSTEDNESGIVATFTWEAQELNSSTKSFDAYITIDDSKGNYDGLYKAKKLAISNKRGITAATFSYPRGDATIDGTLSLKIIPGILDRNFNVRTNGKYEHRFIYAPVTNPVTGRTWLNNNLGAEYANINSKYFNPLNQATTIKSYLAYGSLFEWGRKANGHELIRWRDATHGEPLYGTTTTKADEPSDSLFITSKGDWRINRDDTLWASESSANNVCPVGYRLPLNPNGASDGENEWFVEMSTWDAPDANGSISSYLKLPYAGRRYKKNGQMQNATEYGEYWTGSDYRSQAYNIYFGKRLDYNDYNSRSDGLSVRCIKDQTPAERSDSILLEIANEERNHKSVITVTQLKAITPPLENINDDNENSYRRYIESADTHFSSPATREEVQRMIDTYNTSEDALFSLISTQHKNGKSDIRVAQLQAITPALDNIEEANEKYYQSYIEGRDTNISSPTATRDEVQTMIDDVNALNLPTNAILDRNFYKKTNEKFEHKFVYLPVTNPKTGRTWLNNNLGADYANKNSSAYNPSHQATASNDYLAYGSLFQWGRKADSHELINWHSDTDGTGKYGTTTSKANEPSNSRYIIEANAQHDWRVNQDDTLWASESSPNNICPVGYRLPLNPNEANDGENEWYVETNSWSTKNMDGALTSNLKLVRIGIHDGTNGTVSGNSDLGGYWTGSAYGVNAHTMDFNSNEVRTNNVIFNYRVDGNYVRCIKEQTPSERSRSVLLEIGNEHRNHKSTVTVAQLKAITPALENINDEYQDSYRSYIASRDSNFSSPATRAEVQSMIDKVNRLVLASDATLADIATQHNNGSSDITVAKLKTILPALNNIEKANEKWYQSYIEGSDTNISSPATREEIQSMIDEVNGLNLPDNAILDKNFYKKTHNKFEHRFVYLPVTNSKTGRTWLNNNLGAWYANVGRNIYNPSQQATNANDNYAKGSLFQWGRKADGHELVTRWWGNGTIDQLATTTTKSDNPTDGKFIAVNNDWRVNPNDDLWKGIDAPNNPCPAHYRVPTKKELDIEAQTWNSLTADGSMSSLLKIPGPGWLGSNGYSVYYPGGTPRIWDTTGGFAWTPKRIDSTQRTDGQPVRCIKEQTPAERSASVLLEIGNEHRSHKSIITIEDLKAITPALKNINDDYESSYRRYIVSTSTPFSSPATRDEVQSMIDTANLNPAYIISSYKIAGGANGVALSNDGTKAYIANDHGLVIVDTSDPYNPTKLGSYDTAGWSSGVALSSDGTKAYITNGHGLVIVDISNPVHPTKLGSYHTAGGACDIALSSDGTKAYVADFQNGLVIVDISDPAHPTKLASYDTNEYALDVTLSNDGTKACVADIINGLVIVDISDPAHPTKLGSYDTAGNAKAVILSRDDTKAYVVDYWNGLVIVDISDPAHPIKLGTYNTPGSAKDITLSSDGTKAYVAADKAGGLVIVDISDPAHPTKIDSYDTAGKSYGVTLSSDGTKAYIADGKNGLVIIGGIK